MRKIFAILMLYATCALARVNSGELRLRVLDPSGAGVKAVVNLTNAGSGYSNTFTTDSAGPSSVQPLA
ncbi:MAG: hypothetical protein WA869_13880 [Alloacidobacterium sp.]|jgi:hypothetical protein